jgi:hypothetical protein
MTLPPAPRRPSFFQFRLRSLFILMFSAAIVVWLFTLLEEELIIFFGLMVFPVVALSTSTLGVVYLRGGRRAFWMGFGLALLQVVMLAFVFEFFDRRFMREWEAVILLPILLLAMPVGTGFIGVYFQRMGQKQEQSQPLPSPEANGRSDQQPDAPARDGV